MMACSSFWSHLVAFLEIWSLLVAFSAHYLNIPLGHSNHLIDKTFSCHQEYTIATYKYVLVRGTTRLCKLLIFNTFTKSCFCYPPYLVTFGRIFFSLIDPLENDGGLAQVCTRIVKALELQAVSVVVDPGLHHFTFGRGLGDKAVRPVALFPEAVLDIEPRVVFIDGQLERIVISFHGIGERLVDFPSQ